ncbi:MAG TPA: carboxypeptidase M32 [Candidatus Limnocylindrales bacterium]|jgi:carboxypeptidase Taq|nr:carboxypeptidase M32 [Candidatus Limnocylindrales bacterium]
MSEQFGSYRKLLKRAHQIALLSTAAETLTWDLETYMPSKALAFRAEQLAHLAGQKHRLFTASSTGAWISECEQHGFTPDSAETANVREWRRLYDRATKLSASLVEKFERTRAHARAVWKEARQKSNFKIFKPHLEKLLELNRRRADGWGFVDTPYDALLAEFEPGTRTAQIRTLFGELRPALAPILEAARARSAAIPKDLLHGNYPVAAQQALNREIAEAIGFDFDAGRIDTTTHPFCITLGPADCRLTTRYNEQDFTQSLYGVLHEAGHGLYEQGLPAEHFGTPLGIAASLGIHESQSRLWENHVGRDPAFWERWYPLACRHFPDLKRLTPAQLAAAANRVSPSFIRVEADQVTYDLHIILRFEVEVRLVEGQLAVRDVPAFWNQEFEKMLGLKVTKDSEGCLQDIHWSLGDMGYFPTYTLGNLNAAQLMRWAKTDQPGLAAELAQGEYAGLLKWLREKIHSQGLRYLPQSLIQRATGEPTGVRHHLEYLREKFATN